LDKQRKQAKEDARNAVFAGIFDADMVYHEFYSFTCNADICSPAP
jgi:hypothetical protein